MCANFSKNPKHPPFSQIFFYYPGAPLNMTSIFRLFCNTTTDYAVLRQPLEVLSLIVRYIPVLSLHYYALLRNYGTI